MVYLGYQTIYKGESYLIKSHTGKTRKVDGPAKVLLYRSRATWLPRSIAGQDEYLLIQKVDGEKVVMPGPVAM